MMHWICDQIDSMFYVDTEFRTVSLKEFVEYTFSLFDLNWENYVKVDASLFRPSDITVGFGDNSKAKKILDWQPSCSMHGVIDRIVAQLK